VLDRLGVPEADRDDLAQDIVLDALRCWPSYRAERGTPGQWLWGIVRNHVCGYLRARGRGLGVLAGDGLLDGPSAGPTLEESVSQQRLAARLLARLPVGQQRIVVLYEVWGLTYAEIAALEGISLAGAERHHKKGMRALTAAAEQGNETKLLSLLPLSLPFADGFGPPAEVVARAWERVVAEGLADGPASEPPSSGPRLRAPRERRLPGARPPARLSRLRKLAPLLAVLLGSDLVADGRGDDPPDERSVAMVAAAPAVVLARPLAGAAGPSAATPPRVAAASLTTASHARRVSPAVAPERSDARGAVPTRRDNDAERALMQKARLAVVQGNFSSAIEMLDQHARQFPGGQNVAERERGFAQACARYHDAHPHGGAAELEKRCNRKGASGTKNPGETSAEQP
jgi:RNA polymerase sigma factor (sigma-70 family)